MRLLHTPTGLNVAPGIGQVKNTARLNHRAAAGEPAVSCFILLGSSVCPKVFSRADRWVAKIEPILAMCVIAPWRAKQNIDEKPKSALGGAESKQCRCQNEIQRCRLSMARDGGECRKATPRIHRGVSEPAAKAHSLKDSPKQGISDETADVRLGQ
jgi:hypothetical protein